MSECGPSSQSRLPALKPAGSDTFNANTLRPPAPAVPTSTVFQLLELPEIVATLPAEGRAPGEVVPVRLHARVTDIGTLELLAVPVGGSERWKVELQVRTGAAASD